jgi:tetratricopeptide (TPR) repeat protein
LSYHRQALTISQEVNNWREVGHRLGDIGLLLVDHDPHRSITLLTEQLKLARQLQDRRSEAAATGNLGKAFAISGRYALAKELFDEHLQIAREIGDVRSQMVALTNLGAALSTLGHSDRGLQAFDEALLIASQISDSSGEAKALYDKAVVLERLGLRRTAIELAEAALEIFTDIEERVSALKVKGKLEVWRGLVEVA